MTSEPRDKDYGRTVSEVIKLIPGELEIDAVGLWQIVPHGRDGFGFSGKALLDFVERSIRELLAADAVPVRYLPGSEYDWDVQPQYGTSEDEIVQAVITEWLAMPDDPLVFCGNGVWFARPRPGKKYVKL